MTFMRLTRRLRPWCFAAVFAALPAGAESPRRLVVISWDGAADWVVDRLLAEGRLPHLAALAARGVAAEYSVTTFPSKTAAGHDRLRRDDRCQGFRARAPGLGTAGTGSPGGAD